MDVFNNTVNNSKNYYSSYDEGFYCAEAMKDEDHFNSEDLFSNTIDEPYHYKDRLTRIHRWSIANR